MNYEQLCLSSRPPALLRFCQLFIWPWTALTKENSYFATRVRPWIGQSQAKHRNEFIGTGVILGTLKKIS